jgi:hypothetical protein
MTETVSPRALALVCSLEPSPAPSSRRTLAETAAHLARALRTQPYPGELTAVRRPTEPGDTGLLVGRWRVAPRTDAAVPGRRCPLPPPRGEVGVETAVPAPTQW